MRQFCKFTAIFAATLLFIPIVLIGRAGLFLSPSTEQRFLAHATRRWSQTMRTILGLHVIRNFKPVDHSHSHCLIVSNHQGYLDVVVIGSIFPALFMAKSDVKKWPILGWLATLGGTLYVDRKAFRGMFDAVKKIEKILSWGINVQIFPEGTSTNGDHVLSFKPSLFSAAVSSHSKILPLTIRYLSINDAPFGPRTRDAVCWYGDMNFVHHFWNMLGQKSITASVTAHPAISPDHYPEIKWIAELAHYYVSKNC